MTTQIVATFDSKTARYTRARVELATDAAYVRDEKGKLLERIDGPVAKSGRKSWTLGDGTVIGSECAACSAGRPTKVRELR